MRGGILAGRRNRALRERGSLRDVHPGISGLELRAFVGWRYRCRTRRQVTAFQDVVSERKRKGT